MQTCKPIHVIISLLIFISSIAKAADIKVSGGEDHTLVLTQNKWPWACGANYAYQLGIGETTEPQKTLIQVLGGAMGTPHLQDINNIAAGWIHSLALDVNGFVWAWDGILEEFV
jgi:alpha-tubulin suppressor-like RCC1 family protein